MLSKLAALLNNCLSVKQEKQIHAHILINSLYHLEPLLICQVLLSTRNYSRNIAQYVQQILYHLQNPDASSWGCTIRFFSQHGHFREALSLYFQMQKLGLCPSSYAISSALKACARSDYKIAGISIHTQACKFGYGNCIYVQTALVDLYSKLGSMKTACKVFDEMPEKNVVTWNSILFGHLKFGNLAEAQKFFNEIPTKDVISWNSIISGYARVGNMHQASFLFQQMPERNLASWNVMVSGYAESGNMKLAKSHFDAMPQKNIVSWITMISGYSKCGDVESAKELFSQMAEKDLLSYNAMIACYAQNSRPKVALQLFNQILKGDDIQPDKMTLASVISACSQLGDVRFGAWIESYIEKLGIEMDDHLVTALIDFYSKCGSIEKAYELFHSLRKKDLVAYTAIIMGCGINGKPTDATRLFKAMLDAQIRPNLVTFIGLLTAFNHAGLVEEGYQCFSSMTGDHGLVPSADHYAIMVDLLGRAGRLEEAYELIKSMPMQPHSGVWGALLLACRLHNNVVFGDIAAKHCIELESDTTGYRSLLANIYASVGRWDDANRLRRGMEKKKLAKIPGFSWIEST